MHTTSDQVLEVGMAWEQDYIHDHGASMELLQGSGMETHNPCIPQSS